MPHRTSATALLLASLPYGLALPRAIPFTNHTTLTVPLAPTAPIGDVTVIGTAVGTTVQDVSSTNSSTSTETVTSTISDDLPTTALPTLDPEADILSLLFSEDPVLPDVTVLPKPSEVLHDDDDLIVDPFDPSLSEPVPLPFPLPSFGPENTVPIGTFNAVVQPLLSVIQTLLNALPGNFAPPLPGILIHPLLPTETPDIFIDPLLPTETLADTDEPTATPTDLVDSLLDSLVSDAVASDLPFITKRQEDTSLSTNSILALIHPILELIEKLVAQIPGAGAVPALPTPLANVSALPAGASELSILDTSVPDLSLLSLPDELPESDGVPVETFASPYDLPDLDLPSLPVAAPELPTDVSGLLPNVSDVELPATPLSELPLPSLPVAIPELPTDLADLPTLTNVFDVPVPEGFEDLGDLPNPIVSILPTPSLDDFQIPDAILNVPVPELDDNSVPIDAPLAAVSSQPNLPDSLPTLLDWPFDDWEIPAVENSPPDAPLPSLDDIPIPSDIANVPVPDLDNVLNVPAALAPTPPALVLPTNLADLPTLTDVLGVPVPEEFQDLPALALPTPAIPNLEDAPIPGAVLNVPVPDVDENGVPIDAPALPTDIADLLLPTDVPGVPVPEVFNSSSVPLNLSAPSVIATSLPALPTDLPAPDLPVAAFGAGFPTLPDLPLVPPTVSDVTSALPALPTDTLPTVADLVSAVPAVSVPAIPVVPTLQGVVPAVSAVSAVAVSAVPIPSIVPTIAAAAAAAIPIIASPAVPAVPTLQGVIPKSPLTVPRLPLQVPSAPLQKREMMAAQQAQDVKTGIALSVVKSMLSLVSSMLAKVPGLEGKVQDFGALLPDAETLMSGADVGKIANVSSAVHAINDLIDSLGPIVPVGAATSAVSARPGIGEVVNSVGSAAPKVPLRFGKRASSKNPEEWESFLDELDESKREELKGLIAHSASALSSPDDMDHLAQILKQDFENLDASTKARLLSAWAPGPVLTTIPEKRMRHDKRQSDIPGVQSLGPNLDNAPKVDLSAILGSAGTLDPNHQLTPSPALPEEYYQPAPILPYDPLDPYSVPTNLDPAELAAILGSAGTLDPNGMLSPQVGQLGDAVDDVRITDPYADIRENWAPAFDTSPFATTEPLPGLEATIRASKKNHIGNKDLRLPFARPLAGGSAAAEQAAAAAAQADAKADAQARAEVAQWFNRFVRPSGRSDVDATIVR